MSELSEKDIQFAIKRKLTELGYIVLSTSSIAAGRGRRAASTSSGVPDLLVSHKKWQCGVWLGLEVKTEKGRLTPEQTELYNLGRIVIVRSVEMAVIVAEGWGP